MAIKLSVVIPCRNEERYIGNCLEAVVASAFPKDEIEVIVVDGRSTDTTQQIVTDYSSRYAYIKLLDNPDLTTPFALNIGIKASTGAFIIIFGAHAWFPNYYFSRLVEWHSKIQADCIGGICITDVKNKNKMSESIKNVLGSRFGVGNSDFRLGTGQVKEVDTVAFGCYRREVFEKVGYFDERLTRNQDMELSKRILKSGGKIYLVPDVSYVYYARESLIELAINNYGNGKWNILTVYFTKEFSSLSLRHFVPVIFICSILVPAILIPLWWPFGLLSIGFLLLYLLAVLTISVRLNTKGVTLLNLSRTFVTLHFSYGIGSLAGIMWLAGRIFKSSDDR